MTELWLSRVSLRRDSRAVAALSRILVPKGEAARMAASHHLVWSLFGDSAHRNRDFLWREETPGRFLTLSARPPSEAEGLFAVESKVFAPSLAAGDRLTFALRANPVVSRGAPGSGRGKRHDVVMDALRHIPREERAEHRLRLVATAGQAWLAAQGERHGFALEGVPACDGYEAVQLPRQGQKKPMRFSQIDFTGRLRVTEPDLFTESLAQGFGKAKAFGCGLMLIRRG